MRQTITGVIFFLTVGLSNAQQYNITIGYHYLYAHQWDKAIQIYNFSRPFNEEKQPVLMNGINTSLSYFGKSSHPLKQGIDLSYSFFSSHAQNKNLNNILNLHILKLGYVLHHNHKKENQGLYTDLIISVISTGLYRKVNGQAFVYDEQQASAFGIGSEIRVKVGYTFSLKKRTQLSPFIMLGYTPYLFSPKTEEVINQTQTLASNNWTSLLSIYTGMAVHFGK